MTPLTAADYADLENKSWLTREIVDAAKIQRVKTIEGAEIVGHPATATKDYAGQVFPYFWPGDPHPREYRLRRDNPDLERKADGSLKPKERYLTPVGRPNLFYMLPDEPREWLSDVSIPIDFVEGEKKKLALTANSRMRRKPYDQPASAVTSAPFFDLGTVTCDMAARILDKLRQSPFSVEELAFDRQEWLNS